MDFSRCSPVVKQISLGENPCTALSCPHQLQVLTERSAFVSKTEKIRIVALFYCSERQLNDVFNQLLRELPARSLIKHSSSC